MKNRVNVVSRKKNQHKDVFKHVLIVSIVNDSNNNAVRCKKCLLNI